MLVDICLKFHDASLYGLKVIERTRLRQDFVRDKVPREITQQVGFLQKRNPICGVAKLCNFDSRRGILNLVKAL